MSADELEEMGPVDYLIIEWPGRQPTGEAAPILVDLVDRGLIRMIDIAFLAKGEDGSVTTLELSTLAEQSESLSELAGASSGLLSGEDAEEAATALEPGPPPQFSSVRTGGRRRSPRRCAARALSWSQMAGSRSRASSPRLTPPRKPNPPPPEQGKESSCQDCSEE